MSTTIFKFLFQNGVLASHTNATCCFFHKYKGYFDIATRLKTLLDINIFI